jgi:hypothetical protein
MVDKVGAAALLLPPVLRLCFDVLSCNFIFASHVVVEVRGTGVPKFEKGEPDVEIKSCGYVIGYPCDEDYQ